MKAVGIFTYGGPDVLTLVDLPEPHAGPDEVRVRVRAAAVSPADTLIRAGAAAGALRGRPPYIPGLDAAGVVDEMGHGAEAPATATGTDADADSGTRTGLSVGDRVMALVNPTRPAGGAYAEWIVLPREFVVRAPAGASHAEASTLPLNGLTARLALDKLALSPGQVVGVTGAAGGVGGFAVQLAKADGLRVVADAAPADASLVAALGADAVVERGPEVGDRFRTYAPGGVDAVVDAAVIGAPVLRGIRDGGGLAVVRASGDRYGRAPVPERGIAFADVYVHEYDGRTAELDRLRELAELGALTLRVARTLPAERAPEGHRLLEAGGTRGRIVLTF